MNKPSVQGPNLPYNIANSCSVKYNSSSIFIIGGTKYDIDSVPALNLLSSTWIFDPENDFHMKQGPSLKHERKTHSCGIMKSKGKSLIIVAGGRTGPMPFSAMAITDSVEIYDPMSNQGWKSGICKEIST